MSDTNNNPYAPPPAAGGGSGAGATGGTGGTGGTAGNAGGAAANPYAAPRAAVAHESDVILGGLIENGRRVEAGRGIAWVSEGFAVFMQSPGMWIAMMLVFFLVLFGLILVPILGSLALNILMPVFAAGLLLGCRALEEDHPLEISHLFAGFRERAGPLMLVGLLYFLAIIIVSIGLGIVFFIGAFGMGMTGAMRGGDFGAGMGVASILVMILFFLVALALMLPLAMAVWYAPALVVFHEQEPLAAMKQSFYGCLKNFIPFLIYGIVLFVLAILATLPVGLGWLVLWPVMIGGLYKSYQDIFCEPA